MVVFAIAMLLAGKLARPSKIILLPKPDRRRLVIVAPRELVGTMEFHWASAPFGNGLDRRRAR